MFFYFLLIFNDFKKSLKLILMLIFGVTESNLSGEKKIISFS